MCSTPRTPRTSGSPGTGVKIVSHYVGAGTRAHLVGSADCCLQQQPAHIVAQAELELIALLPSSQPLIQL